MDRNLVDGDKVVRSSYFSACCDGGHGCHSAALRGDHHRDVVWWSRWSELSRASRDVVDVVWWSRWSELGRAARDVVDVVWWSTWSELSGARSVARRGLLDGSLLLANSSDSLFNGLESHLGDDVAVGDLCGHEMRCSWLGRSGWRTMLKVSTGVGAAMQVTCLSDSELLLACRCLIWAE